MEIFYDGTQWYVIQQMGKVCLQSCRINSTFLYPTSAASH